MRFAALLCILATPVFAQDHATQLYSSTDPDDLVIRESQDGHFAEIYYDNSAAQSSTGGDFVLEWEGEQFAVNIRVGSGEVDFAEVITVVPPDHLLAVPNYQEVPDGETFTIVIMRPMF